MNFLNEDLCGIFATFCSGTIRDVRKLMTIRCWSRSWLWQWESTTVVEGKANRKADQSSFETCSMDHLKSRRDWRKEEDIKW